jgi:hypothetical protein
MIMFNLIKKIRNWFLPNHEGPFEYSPIGFIKAKRWSKNQPHPKFPDHTRYSLWDYVNNNWIDSEYKLHEINKVKTNNNKAI